MATVTPARIPARVIFRVWRFPDDGQIEVLAILPDLPWDRLATQVTCYAHVGQHSGCDYRACLERSREASPAEYAPLARELETIGYEVVPITARQYRARQQRRKRR